MIKTVVITHNPVNRVNFYNNKDINYWKRIFSLKGAMLMYSYNFTFLEDVLEIIAGIWNYACDVVSTSCFWELLLEINFYRYLSTVRTVSISPQSYIKSHYVSVLSFQPQLEHRKFTVWFLFSTICKPREGEDKRRDNG